MKLFISFILVCLTVGVSRAQKPDFKVLAFYSRETDMDSRYLQSFLTRASDEENFTFDVTTDWTNLNDTLLRNYQVVMWINDFPKTKAQRQSFVKFIENGGGWIGLRNVWGGDKWPWFADFTGTTGHCLNANPLPARVLIDDKNHPIAQNIPPFVSASPNNWCTWKPNPRDNKDVQVLLTLDPLNYPLGPILTGGDIPLVWARKKYKMIYIDLGYDHDSDYYQKNIFADAISWVGKKSVPKRKAMPANNNLPEMIKVEGGSFTMGDNNGDNGEKPAHEVTVGGFQIAKTETTIGQWRNFCFSTGREMPEAPWFQQSEQHPVINVSWDHAIAYCKWLSDVTGKHYRLPTEAEWEFAARGGVKGKGFPYSGGKNADSVAWLAHKTEGTMPVGQKAPNELGLYDMTGNVWEWCSDWYEIQYYSVSEKVNPIGPKAGLFYTTRGGAWDIGLRNNRIAYRNPLAPTSRNHNKGFRVVCEP